MIKIDRDGLLLCELQAKAFELSITLQNTSSEIFVRRFMNSKVAKDMDNLSFLQTNLQPKDMLERVDEEYGESNYGSKKFAANEMYWIGYIYRYYAYTYGKSSQQIYKTLKPKDLRDVYLPYHTMDPAQAIDRILESKGIYSNVVREETVQYEIFKRVRQGK